MTTVHVAGPPQMGGLYQECARCRYVLQDYTGGAVMIPEGQDLGIPHFPEGRRIAISGNAAWALADDVELDDDETECRPTS
ncbi:hypothetical protein [Nonomuraea angiospora]|uniref:hypothetical protein n=1 Tax=Nonomuraea angiospora TaxID=46172 RepID=UPI0029BA31FB|nr:hypothetical protein [Nonomuraea angiospora]MDX3111387.1 hypothetical protein [Nonomuraea angiospora]